VSPRRPAIPIAIVPAGSSVSAIPRPGTLWRTVRHLRPKQAGHQLLHVVRRAAGRRVRPVPWAGPPPALVAADAGPFLPAPPHAQVGPGGLRLLNRTVEIGDPVDWDHAAAGPLWAFHLHQLDWLRHPDLAPEDRTRHLLDWVERHRQGIGWQPGPISLRALTWLKLLTTPGALALDDATVSQRAPDAAADAGGAGDTRRRLLASLASQLETLQHHLEHRLLANHYLSNLLALVAGGAALEGPAADAWLGHGPALRDELREQVLPDGAHVERSPMYHALLLENVLDVLGWVRAAARQGRALPGDLEAELAAAAARMLGALQVYTHPDGEIALFADSAFGIAHPPEALAGYAAARGIAPRPPARRGVLAHAGYVRMERGPWSLLVSAAGPMPPYQPGHAHCDALAFELCVEGRRVVADTGVFEYVPGPRRHRARATRSHATLEVDGRDQAEIWGAHRVGGRPRVRLVAAGSGADAATPGRGAVDAPDAGAAPQGRAQRGPRASAPDPPVDHVEATCAGWATPDAVHRRVLALDDAGLTVTDTIEGRRPRRVLLVLPLAPGIEPRWAEAPEAEAHGGQAPGAPGSGAGAAAAGSAPRVLLAVPDGPVLVLTLPCGPRWRVERLDYYPEFGRCIERAALVGEAGDGAEGEAEGPGPFVWRLERAEPGAESGRERGAA